MHSTLHFEHETRTETSWKTWCSFRFRLMGLRCFLFFFFSGSERKNVSKAVDQTAVDRLLLFDRKDQIHSSANAGEV